MPYSEGCHMARPKNTSYGHITDGSPKLSSKKRGWIAAGIFFGVILLVAAMIILPAITLFGEPPTRYIGAACDLSHISVRLPFFYRHGKVYPPGDCYSTFQSQETLEELAERINTLQEEGYPYQAEVMSNRYLLLEAAQGEATGLFFICSREAVAAGNQNHYTLGSAGVDIDGMFVIYFPEYLLAGETPNHLYLHKEIAYEVTGDKELFLDFYHRTDLYRIEEREDGFVLSGGEVPVTFAFHTKGSREYVTLMHDAEWPEQFP